MSGRRAGEEKKHSRNSPCRYLTGSQGRRRKGKKTGSVNEKLRRRTSVVDMCAGLDLISFNFPK